MALDTLQTQINGHTEELLAFLSRRTRTRTEAEDLCQETWLRIHRSSAVFEDDSGFRAYMYTVARRLLIDHHRRRSARVQLVSLEGGVGATQSWGPDAAASASQILEVVERTLLQMKPEIAEVWRWRMTQDISFKDIAARQDCGLNTALGRMHRATKIIATALDAAGLRGKR